MLSTIIYYSITCLSTDRVWQGHAAKLLGYCATRLIAAPVSALLLLPIQLHYNSVIFRCSSGKDLVLLGLHVNAHDAALIVEAPETW